MKIKGVHEEEIKKYAEKSYGIIIDKIKYFPIGEDGASYIINSGKKKYYLKVGMKHKYIEWKKYM